MDLDRDNSWQVILKSGCEGGCITLYGKQEKSGWIFKSGTNEAALAYFCNEEDLCGDLVTESKIATSWEDALALLNPHWPYLYADQAHPAFSKQIMDAIINLSKQSEYNAERVDWARWDECLYGSTKPEMHLSESIALLDGFSGKNLSQNLSSIESLINCFSLDNYRDLLEKFRINDDLLVAAGHVKRLSGQINVIVHAVGILLSLPKLLEPGEKIESVSLGAGNTGRCFDLETDRRIAEFKFINWRGADAMRQNSLFKDFYGLAEYETDKSKYLYLLGTEIPLRFLKGKRAVRSVLSKHLDVYNEFTAKYPDYRTVNDYYGPRQKDVQLVDVSLYVPGIG